MKTEEYIKIISKETGLSEKEIQDMVEGKKTEYKGLIDDNGALFVISRELGVDVTTKKKGKKKNYSEMLSDSRPTLENINKENKLTTGSKLLDALLGGGLEPGSIYEVFADYGVGKSQLSHQLCVNIQLPYEKGGLEGGAFYIDSGGSFRPERIIEMAEAFDLNHVEILKNITFGRAYNSDHQALLIKEVANLIKEKNIKILIVDALASHIISEYIGHPDVEQSFKKPIWKSHLANKQFKLVLSHLRKLAKEYNLIVFFTYSLRYITERKMGDPFKPVRGTVLAHKKHTRVYIKKTRSEMRMAHLIHSPKLPVGGVPFSIEDEGIRDN